MKTNNPNTARLLKNNLENIGWCESTTMVEKIIVEFKRDNHQEILKLVSMYTKNKKLIEKAFNLITRTLEK
ncbi:MAG: hypothetical protein ACJA0H_000421 [Francisellaceae bacterium]|jgi:hypothetical protein